MKYIFCSPNQRWCNEDQEPFYFEYSSLPGAVDNLIRMYFELRDDQNLRSFFVCKWMEFKYSYNDNGEYVEKIWDQDPDDPSGNRRIWQCIETGMKIFGDLYESPALGEFLRLYITETEGTLKIKNRETQNFIEVESSLFNQLRSLYREYGYGCEPSQTDDR